VNGSTANILAAFVQNTGHIFHKIRKRKDGKQIQPVFFLRFLKKAREYRVFIRKCLINSHRLIFGMRIAFISIIIAGLFNTKEELE